MEKYSEISLDEKQALQKKEGNGHKKSIGILTFHYVDNYGAVLQAWALREVINRFPDCIADIINYVPPGYVIYPYESTEIGVNKMIKKRKRYEEFLRTYCGVDSPIVHKVIGNKYDFYCVGSDQVWNFDFRENQDQEYLFPNLDDKAIRFSYAASIKEKSIKEKDIFYQHLSRFKMISLREHSFLSEMQNYCKQKIVQVLDPTLLLTAEDYNPLVCLDKLIEDKFIFFFIYPIGDAIREYVPFVNTLARKYHLKILHTCFDAPDYMFVNNAGCVMYEGINEFLWYMKHAEIVVTTSYHGMIFSLVFQRPFYLFIREAGKERLLELTELLGLQDRVVTNYIPANRLSDDINYKSVNKILNRERKRSNMFLKSVMDLNSDYE